MRSCSNVARSLAKVSAKKELIKVGAIDQYNNVLDERILNQQMARFRRVAENKYGIKAAMIQYEDVIGSRKVVFNQSAFLAIDILNGKHARMALDPQTLGYVNQGREAQSQAKFAPAFDPSTFFNQDDNANTNSDPNSPATEAPTQGATRLAMLKSVLLSKAKERLVTTNRKINETKGDLVEYNKNTKLKKQLETHIDRLEAQISEINRLDSRAPEIIAPYITSELGRLKELSISNDPDQLSEARTIVRFISDMAEFDRDAIGRMYGGQHPIYMVSELYDDDYNFLLTEGMVAPFREWARQAKEISRDLAAQNAKVLEDHFNNNAKIKQTFAEKLKTSKFNFDDIQSTKDGLKDASWIDSMIMDISGGITSHNGLLPQVIRNVVDNNFEKQYAWAKEIEENINLLTPKVTKELQDLEYNLTKFGILGVNGANWDLFKQMIPGTEGQSSGNIVHKYSYTWFETLGEMKDKFNQSIKNAKDNPDEAGRRHEFREAVKARNAWYKANTNVVNPGQLSAIINDPEFASLSQYFSTDDAAISAHEALLTDAAGQEHVNKVIENQKTKLKQYMAQLDGVKTELMADENIDDIANLSENGRRKLAVFETENNPFLSEPYIRTGTPLFVGSYDYHPKLVYTESIPKKDMGHYDDNFRIIEGNPTLKEFYDVAYEATSGMRERFSYDIQKKLSTTSLPFLEQSIIEIMTDKNLTAYQAISKVFRKIIDSIMNLFTIHKQDQWSYAQVDPNTGQPGYKVNDNFITQNLSKIGDLFLANSTIAGKELGMSIKRFTNARLAALSDQKINYISIKFLGKQMTREQMLANFGEVIPVGKIIYRNAQHEIAKEKSFDLPKVIKLYSHLSAQYSARQEMMPLIEMMKMNYQQIKGQKTNNISEVIKNFFTKNAEGKREGFNRTEQTRDDANKQMENWFERVVLGNTGLRKHYGVGNKKYLTKEELETKENTEKALEAMLGQDSEGKINYAAIATLNEQDKGKALKLKGIVDNLGQNYAASAIIDSFMTFLRFKGLGFNISSGINNFVEGQVANSITAATGNYFDPEHIYILSPTDMIAGDLIKQKFPGGVPEKVAKAEFLVQAADVLQDNSNELQKATTKTAFSFVKRLNPYYLIAKTEQYNQVPLMVATLKSEPITAKDGTVSNVWDALEGQYVPDAKQWTVKLKPEFATKENKEAWEHFSGDNYNNWKSKIKQVIANTHGDFSDTGGMMAKSFQSGQALLMFKTWLPKEFYKRFAVEQTDLATGIQGFKGRWRSHTPVSAGIQGAIMGTYAFGGFGAVAGAAIGSTLGYLYGAKTNMSVLQELSLASKLLFRKMIGMPVNIAGSLVGRKNLVNTQLNSSIYKDMEGFNFSKQDFNNFRGNMQEMATMLSFFGLLLLTKAFFWDDDDKGDDPRRMAHNILANRFMQLSSSGMMYANLTDLQKTASPAIIKFFGDVGDVGAAFAKFIEGDDTLQSGPAAGESRLKNQAMKTFLPGLLQSPFSGGFQKQTERQFVPSHWDSAFFGEEKEAKTDIKKMKAERRADLREEGTLTEDQIDKQMKKEFGRKARGQTNVDYLDQIISGQEARENAEQ